MPNQLKKCYLVAVILLTFKITYCQKVYPIVIGENGIITGNSKLNEVSVAEMEIERINSGKLKAVSDPFAALPDTISIAEAKKIIALNAILTGKGNKINRLKIVEYQMNIGENTNTCSLKSNSEVLSPEMKSKLSKIKSGESLIFEYIKVKMPDGTTRSLPLLNFIVI